MQTAEPAPCLYFLEFQLCRAEINFQEIKHSFATRGVFISKLLTMCIIKNIP